MPSASHIPLLNPNATPFQPRRSRGSQRTTNCNNLKLFVTSLNIGFLNICSLRYKLHALDSLAHQHNWDVVGVAETWLDSTISDGEICIPGYSVVRCDRPDRQGGGTCLYYKTSLPVTYRSDLHNSHLEASWIAIGGGQHQHLVGCLYRPPNATADFWGHLDTVLHNAATITPSMTLVGDFNINLAQCMSSRPHQRFWDLIGSYGLRNYVQSATRVTPRCPDGTLLDLVLSTVGTISHCEVVPCTISDHFLVHASLSLPSSQHQLQRKSVRPTRKIRAINVATFREDIASCSLHSFPPAATVDEMWNGWHAKFMSVLESHAPLCEVRISTRRTPPPWSDRDLFQLNMRKNILHRKWLRDKTNVHLHEEYKRARAEASNAYRRKRNQHFQQQCRDHSSNLRKMWSVINSVTSRSRQHHQPTCDITEVSDAFHSIVHDPSRPAQLQIPIGPQPQGSMLTFQSTTPDEVKHLLERINPCKATGSDGIPGCLLRACADLLAPSLSVLFSSSLRHGEVPLAFKHAVISPLFKAGDPSVAANYRPVSLLPIVSKLLEKIVQKQLVAHLERSCAIPPTQFAFRREHSTEDALVVATDAILKARDDKLTTGVCLIDMSKAFDKAMMKHLLNNPELHKVVDMLKSSQSLNATVKHSRNIIEKCNLKQVSSQLYCGHSSSTNDCKLLVVSKMLLFFTTHPQRPNQTSMDSKVDLVLDNP
ncbi:uncharacterized protein LOC135821708 [Sycon ciliatum]|uniref:uncharacterized protein LOC135821708 n=1 Tax=Sycon ciliatum TaxID=27933 RepID=UPI0031F6430D